MIVRIAPANDEEAAALVEQDGAVVTRALVSGSIV